MSKFQMRVLQALLGVTALAMSGCVSMNTMQTANTLGTGKTQVGLEPAYQGAAGGGSGGALPRFDLAARYGVSDTVDIGGRVGSSGFEFQTKFLLSDPADNSLALSLAPSVGGFAAVGEGAAGILNFSVPLLIGLPVGDSGSQLVLGPKFIDILLFGANGDDSASVNLLFIGTTIGFSAKLGESFRIMPELGLAYPLVGTASSNGDSFTDTLGGGVMFQFGVGLLFGG